MSNRNVVRLCGMALALAALLVVQVGCGGDSVSASGTEQIGIEITSLSVTVENKSGLALRNLTLVIEPIGLQKTSYKTFIDRLENQDKRTMSLAEFGADDGTPFNRRIRARAVRVTGEDITGKQYEAIVPWDM